MKSKWKEKKTINYLQNELSCLKVLPTPGESGDTRTRTTTRLRPVDARKQKQKGRFSDFKPQCLGKKSVVTMWNNSSPSSIPPASTLPESIRTSGEKKKKAFYSRYGAFESRRKSDFGNYVASESSANTEVEEKMDGNVSFFLPID